MKEPSRTVMLAGLLVLLLFLASLIYLLVSSWLLFLMMLGSGILFLFGSAGISAILGGIKHRRRNDISMGAKTWYWSISIFVLDLCAIGGAIYLLVLSIIRSSG